MVPRLSQQALPVPRAALPSLPGLLHSVAPASHAHSPGVHLRCLPRVGEEGAADGTLGLIPL